MAYAAVQDLIARYGEAELISLTTPSGQDLTQIDQVRVGLALDNASSEIDSYLRRRYAVPLVTPDKAVIEACCKLARYDLASGPNTTPTDAMRAGRKDAIAWLTAITTGQVTLDGSQPEGQVSFARSSDRRGPLGPGGFGNSWPHPDDFWP
ncbi:gp436 family protein [Acidisoma sp. 7E03]